MFRFSRRLPIRYLLLLLGILCAADWAAASQAAAVRDVMAEKTPVVPVMPAHFDKGSDTGLPIPRFISLVSDEVNMRVGPGFQYPIEWTYRRKGLPIEVEREFDVWRLVRAPDGGRGWVHEATVSGTRTFIVVGGTHDLRRAPEADAPVVAVLDLGVIGTIRRCKAGDDWCAVRVANHRGYLPRKDFWGTFAGEAVR
ncbi:MAG: SH3 domain-containing protein [Acetobacteraceae bacterium]